MMELLLELEGEYQRGGDADNKLPIRNFYLPDRNAGTGEDLLSRISENLNCFCRHGFVASVAQFRQAYGACKSSK